MSSKSVVEVDKSAPHYTQNPAKIELHCSPHLISCRRCQKIFKSTAKLSYHLSQDHTNPIENEEVNRIKKVLEGISLGFEIGVLQ